MRSLPVHILIPVVIYGLHINHAGAGGLLSAGELAIKEAILEIFEENFMHLTTVVNFLVAFDEDGPDDVGNRLIRDLMAEIYGNFTVIIESFDGIRKHWRRKKEFCVFFVDSHSSFLKIFEKMTTDLFKFQGYYVVVYLQPQDNHKSDYQKVVEAAWKKYIINLVILSEENSSVHVHTYFPFTKFFCEEAHQVLWNTYRRHIGFVHKARPIFPNKLRNFHKCQLSVATLENPPFMMSRINSTGHVTAWGLDGILIWGLQNILGFTVNKIYLHKQSWTNTTDGDVYKRALDMVEGGLANFSIGFMITTGRNDSGLIASYSYYTTNLVWAIPSGNMLTPFQIFTKPFQRAIWSLLLMTMAVSCVAVWVINRRSKKIQNFVYGCNIKNPILNMFNIFLGGSLHKTPARNFARFLLAIFILYSMVIRNAYQGALFHFMRMEEQPQDIKYIKDIVSKKYDLYALDSLKDYIDQIKNTTGLIAPLNIAEFETFRFKLKTHKSLALLTSEDHIAYWNKIGFPENFFNFCPEKVTAVNLGIYFPRMSCLVSEFNKKIFELTDYGFMDIYRIQTIEKKHLRKKVVASKPKQLKIRQIEGGNSLLQVGVILSAVVFVFEVAIGKIFRKLRKKS